MKLILLALLSLTAVNSFLFRVPDALKNLNDAPSCITDYYTAFFAYFDLDKPTQLLNCYDGKSADLYWKHVFEVADLARDAECRNRAQVHLDFIKLGLIDKGLQPVFTCIVQTQDWSDLLDALGEERDPQRMALAGFIHFQAKFGELADELHNVTEALGNKNFSNAGELAAATMNKSVNEVKKQGVALLALNGLWNGVHIALGLPDAESIQECWNNDTAKIRLEFIYGMSVAVANGSVWDAASNTETWYNETGKDLINQIPDDAWKCWANSTDTKSESEKLLIDISSQWFFERVSKFVHEHQWAYWHLQNNIKTALEQHNFIHAGSAYGNLLQASAATN